VKTIYVKNLPQNASKEKIKKLFDKLGEVTKIVLPPPRLGIRGILDLFILLKDQAH
jgi:heterogeneous nuclear ribonucleoprotein R